jgi:hypothetical protein
MLEDPGKFYWKWQLVGFGLLVLYGVERFVRTDCIYFYC